MDEDRIRVAIVGGGETGTPLLENLLQASFVEVTGIADLDASAPGIALARDLGIATSTDFLDLVRVDVPPDIVIDVTGAAEVRTSLRQHLQATGSDQTVIMNEIIARLPMSLASGKLVRIKHKEQAY